MSNKKILNQVGSCTLSIFIALVVAFSISLMNIKGYVAADEFAWTYDNAIKTEVTRLPWQSNMHIKYADGRADGYVEATSNIDLYNVKSLEVNTKFSPDNATNGTIFLFSFKMMGGIDQLTSDINISYSLDGVTYVEELYHTLDANVNGVYSYFTPTWLTGNYCWVKIDFVDIYTERQGNRYWSLSGYNPVYFYFDPLSIDTLKVMYLSSISSKLKYISLGGGASSVDLSVTNALLNNINFNTSQSMSTLSSFSGQIEGILDLIQNIYTIKQSDNNWDVQFGRDFATVISNLNQIVSGVTNIDNKLSTVISNQQSLIDNLILELNKSDLTNEKLNLIYLELKDISDNIGNITINVTGGDITINDIINNYNSIVNNYNTINNYLSDKVTNLTTINNDLDNGTYNLSDQLINSIALPVNFINGLYTGNSGIQILLWLPLLLSLVLLIIGRGRKG